MVTYLARALHKLPASFWQSRQRIAASMLLCHCQLWPLKQRKQHLHAETAESAGAAVTPCRHV
jgi:hypothetical protein